MFVCLMGWWMLTQDFRSTQNKMGEKKGIVGHEGGKFEREGLRKDEGGDSARQ